ncbi:MAG: YfiT family bacillithiol transferase [Bacteroidota bacterium]
MTNDTNLSFPIGPYKVPHPITETHLQEWIQTIRAFPNKLEAAVTGLSDEQLDTPYRPGGWTVRQLVHHIADSHMNAYTRFKLGISEENPTIKPYDQEAWSKMVDSQLPISLSLGIIKGLHERWATFLQANQDWQRTIFHPEAQKVIPLDALAGDYAWHSEHHLAHILNLIEREGW